MARSVNVVLQKDVEKLGKGGDVVKVSPGYARNYLVPKGFALPASEGNVARFEHIKRLASERAAKSRAEAQALATKLSAVEITLSARAGSEGKLYGSITSKDIETALRNKGFDLDRKKLKVDAIRSVGTFEVGAHLAPEINATFKVIVVAGEA
ncbi:MAG: 50S ribosomal protein L9 [Deltaproteobacteria bacterium]|nr:50S ribosomal protein L9 [Deltaproteobacteria bacterium]